MWYCTFLFNLREVNGQKGGDGLQCSFAFDIEAPSYKAASERAMGIVERFIPENEGGMFLISPGFGHDDSQVN